MRSILLILALLSTAAASADEIDIHHKFTAGEKWKTADVAALKQAGWKVNPPADRNDAFFVTTEKLGKIDGYLSLVDVVDSAAIQGNNLDGTPVATLSTGKLVSGKVEIIFATDGLQKQVASIALMRGETVLAEIAIDDNTNGRFILGDAITPFSDTESWWRSTRKVTLTWTAAADGNPGTVAFTFKPIGKESQAITVTDKPLVVAGVPDALRLKVGFATAVNRGLLIDELRITGVKAAE